VQKSISLSNDTVAHRINEMGNKEEQLCAILRNSPFTLQLDEMTTPDINALLMAYVRFKAPSSEDMAEEFLFSKCLKTDTKGQTIFNAVHGYLQEKSIPITNILACTIDRAPSMGGFTALLKEQVPKVLTVHCIQHCHNLVAKCKNPAPNESLSAVKVVNKIKPLALNDRRFRELCQENDEIFQRLLHTNVRWLSRGNCLVCFCSLFDSIVEFLESVNAALGHCDIRYLSDFFEKMNSHIKALRKWSSCPVQSSHPQSHFPQLTKVVIIIDYTYLISMNYCIVSEELTDDCLLIYVEHLKMVQADLAMRFRDLLDLEVLVWVVQLFQADVVDCEIAIQEHLVNALWEKARLLLLAFPTTYLVEQPFSQVLHMQSKYRNRLDSAASGALRLKLTSLQPATKKLAEKHQVQGSH
uniref:DUF4371 domain-containing protein n=1 Tax=Poecilia formosa TaxID=48698 RepID=A0A096M6F6_POEFO